MNLKVNSTLIFLMIACLEFHVAFGFQNQESAKSFQEIARIDMNENTTPEQIMQFNAKADELGFAKPCFYEKTVSSARIIFSNGVQLKLKWPFEQVRRITKDFVIINEYESNNTEIFNIENTTKYIKRVYDRNGRFLFSQSNGEDFYLVPTELGFVFRMASRKPITLHDKFGRLISTFPNLYSVNDWRMVYASPDKSYFIINSMINDHSGKQHAAIGN